MTWKEMMEILDWLTPRTREVARWSEEQVYAFYEDLRRWSATGVQRAVETLYEDGSKISNGGVVIRQLRALGYRPELEANEQHEHRWAIVEYEDDRDDGKRLGVCVFQAYEGADRCGLERLAEPSALRTISEIRDDDPETVF